MEGRVHDEPARITGFVPRLATGSRATAEGWRQTWLSQGYREVAGAEAKTPGQFSMAGARWHIVPKDGPQLEVRVHNGRIQSLRRVGDAQILPAWDFPPSVISLLTDE